MRISYALLGDTKELFRKLVDAMNQNITFEDNIRVKVVAVPDSGTANTSFTVTHNLGKIPIGYIANIDRSGNVYDYNKSTWTATTMTLKCTAANAVLSIVIF